MGFVQQCGWDVCGGFAFGYTAVLVHKAVWIVWRKWSLIAVAANGLSDEKDVEVVVWDWNVWYIYRKEYSHKQYTLGFGWRPGGPGFYINTDYNSDLHGPGGQIGYDLHEEADSCFAEVIEGHEVIDRMHEKNLDENDETFTLIESITFMTHIDF